MSQRPNTTKWFCYILALSAGPLWNPVRSVTVKTPPSSPTAVQAQAKFFQDFFSVQLSPYKIEFGHVCEDPHNWEQRYEKKDFKNHRDMGKVRWGDKKGGYGEHYWDLNHAGHAGNHGDDGYGGDSDDGSYHVREHPSESYDEPNDHSSYSNDDYDPEKSSGSYEESGRSKRAYQRTKVERKPQKVTHEDNGDYDQKRLRKQSRKHTELETAPSHKVEQYSDEEDTNVEVYKKPKRRQQPKQKEEYQQPREEKNQVVLVVKEKDDVPEPKQYDQTQQSDVSHYVNYEGGAGVRQHQQPEAAASTAPRLFLEHSTGRVVDRATGQAYILQPILTNY